MDAALDRPGACADYRRRRPERTPLYQSVQWHLETYLALAREGRIDGDGVPKRLRYFLQRDHEALGAVLRILLRVIEARLRERSRCARGRLAPRRGLVVTAAALNADEAGVSLH